jgi:hypothetical protein
VKADAQGHALARQERLLRERPLEGDRKVERRHHVLKEGEEAVTKRFDDPPVMDGLEVVHTPKEGLQGTRHDEIAYCGRNAGGANEVSKDNGQPFRNR